MHTNKHNAENDNKMIKKVGNSNINLGISIKNRGDNVFTIDIINPPNEAISGTSDIKKNIAPIANNSSTKDI